MANRYTRRAADYVFRTATETGGEAARGLLWQGMERAACGVGFVADVAGTRTHRIVQMAVTAAVNLTHRGAVSADGKSGDGAGVLTQVPVKLMERELARQGRDHRFEPGDLAVGMLFLPHETAAAERSRRIVDQALAAHALAALMWRPVPVDTSALGDKALRTMPTIAQVLVARPPAMDRGEFTRSLYLARKAAESEHTKAGVQDFYAVSFSEATLVYKGLLVAPQLTRFYPDLKDQDYESALAVFHQRYSTNTFPTWALAHPFRFLAHNGEINTLQGNVNWVRAREPEMTSHVWGDRVRDLRPIIQPEGSDSAQLDNVLEALVHSGRGMLHAMSMLIPEAWENMPNLDPKWRSYYQFNACVTEPWDGPAALAFSDGVMAAAALDRNGLRPARYQITDDGIVTMASEVGVLDAEGAQIVEKGRLGPGQTLAVDTVGHRILKNAEIKDALATQHPYDEWVQRHLFSLSDHIPAGNGASPTAEPASQQLQKAFGYTSEELHLMLLPMVSEAIEPVGSMGDDTPLSVLATKPRLLYAYFKQKFAQVTNPPIDPLREQIVMALHTYLGRRGSLLEESPEHARLLFLPSPVLLDHELNALRNLPQKEFGTATISCLFPAEDGPEGLKAALGRVCDQVVQAVESGARIIVLSDRGVDAQSVPIPMLLATGAVHHHLIRRGIRMQCSLVVETAEAREMHHLACLVGYGAHAVNPYLAFSTVRRMVEDGHYRELQETTLETAQANYRKTLEKQLLKIMSKIGISAVASYRGAQIFEAIGIGSEVIDSCFAGTISQIGGIGFTEIAEEALARHALAYEDGVARLEDYGYYRFRKAGEPRAFSPLMTKTFHKGVANGGSQEDYREFVRQTTSVGPLALRDLLRFTPLGPAVPVDEVEPAQEIVTRFSTGSMSLGALSPEAHETLAIATNRIGAKANTGEGGEPPERYSQRNGHENNPNSHAKQVASGRFGVTPAYLANAMELEIKMAQGSKPGEGGQLPGHKVVAHIARLRHTREGVPLISPPPHHDIYSIEDLAQLIYDLKVVNPRARVSVKLVAEAGVGTIAAGVAKGYADTVQVSGHEGGTGASPLSSVKNAGSPWELGVAETQQVLVSNDLRGRVTLRTDGMMRSGRDVIMAALLGAEEYGFGTASLIAVGCTMARQCHLNTCPTGIATQDARLREKFKGTAENLINYFFHVAEEVREILASLGARNLEEIIGRVELLQQVEAPDHPKANTLDLGRLLAPADPSGSLPRYRVQSRNDRPEPIHDDALLPRLQDALEGKASVRLELPIRNTDRTVGGRVAGEVAYRYGDPGLPHDITIELLFRGSAGQSFGAWCTHGMRLVLSGEANDYVGKGMYGGEIVLHPPEDSTLIPHENVIMGNTSLYGAIGGALFAAGRAGERFAVRNSGAWAVVEGTGDHCCEYMTGGGVVVLGKTGRNLGAGMSGGVAYVLDATLPATHNPEMVQLERVEDPHDADLLHSLTQRHHVETGSSRAKEILENWDGFLPHFWKVTPKPTVAPPQPREVQRQQRDRMLAATRTRVSSGDA